MTDIIGTELKELLEECANRREAMRPIIKEAEHLYTVAVDTVSAGSHNYHRIQQLTSSNLIGSGMLSEFLDLFAKAKPTILFRIENAPSLESLFQMTDRRKSARPSSKLQ